MYTVKSLRSKGWKVRVTHTRMALIDGFKVSKAYSLYEIKRQAYRMSSNYLILAQGGHTLIEITSPKGNHYGAGAKCSLEDNFCKKTGVKIALDRVLNKVIAQADYDDLTSIAPLRITNVNITKTLQPVLDTTVQLAETPEEKAKRLGVPLIPYNPRPAITEVNPVISVCGACSLELRQIMGYYCPRSDCPCNFNACPKIF